MIRPYRAKRRVRPYGPAVLDIETEPVKGKELAVGFAWESTTGTVVYEAFKNWREWFDHYRALYKRVSKGNRLRLRNIYAHNGGGFDWLHLYVWLQEQGYIVTLKSFQSGNSIVGLNIKLRINGERFTLRLRDSMRLLPASLKTLAATFHVKHQKIDLGDELPHQTLKRAPALFWEYLELDCRALQDVLLRFWRLIVTQVGNIEDLPLTLPALAMRLWRMTLTEPMYTSRQVDLKRLERLAYKGGRTEALAAGAFDVRVYDVNSEYPAAMMAGTFPVSYLGAWTDTYRGFPGIYHVRFEQTNRARLPVLAVLNEREHRLEFTYAGEGVYTQPELARLVEIGGQIECIEGYEYFEMGNPFKPFISRWYNLRKSTDDEGLRYVCKILMNSLYGKFGQEEAGWSLQVWSADDYAAAIEAETVYKDYGSCVMVLEERANETTFFGIAAYITSQARLMLYDYACQAEDTGARVVYMDTDSIHMTGGDDLPIGPDLGELKEEYRGEAIYLGRKLYHKTETGENKAKGVGKREAAKLTRADFLRMIAGESIEIHFESFPTPLEVFTGAAPPAVMVTRTRTLRSTIQTRAP